MCKRLWSHKFVAIGMIWVMMVFLHGTEIQENVYFNDLDTCLEFAERVRAQDYHQRVAGDKIYLKVYCVPQKGD